MGITGKALDGRSYYHDTVNFTYRAYVSTAEVLSYLPSSDNRKGQFPVIINTGGTLTNGVITGGTNDEWWFKDGVADGNLVLKNSGAVAAPSISTKTSNYAILTGDDTILVNTTSGPVTITYNPGLDTKIRRIKNIGSSGNNVTITPSTGTIDGNSSNIVADFEVRTIQSNLTNLYLL